tara:strand:+ start:5378 stop:6358 length:981 start_codon:yes stop_codon:yes gene_type:complete
MNKTFVIAEAGANHDRKFNQALKLVNLAVVSGCDAVKFQTYSSETLYRKNTPDFAGYKDVNNLIKEIELPREWQPQLKSYCDYKGIEFMSTPFDEEAVEELVGIGVSRLKISGFESTDFKFIEMVASSKLPLVISLGIGFPANYLGKIFDICEKHSNELTLLHCNNAYPTPTSDLNLKSMIQSKHLRFDCKVGLSDHSTSVLTPALAVALGAQVIEKHFTLDRNLDGPDHKFALEPEELQKMVEYIRFAEEACGVKDSDFTKSEEKFKFAMRSIVAKKQIKKGDIFSKDNITTKRPCLENDTPAMNYEFVIGKKSLKDFDIDEAIR